MPITSLSELVAQVESNSKLSALRFEPAYHPDTRAVLLARQFWPGLSVMTYETVLASSWGMFQIMGDNIYMLGFDRPLLDYWQSSELQIKYFHLFCASRHIDYSLDDILNDANKRADFAHHYNGNPIGYGNRLLQVYEQGKA